MKGYNNIDDAYSALVGPLKYYASQHIFNKDYAIDAVHDAFQKALEYVSKHPKTRISAFLLRRETARACRRLNKYSREISIPFGFENVEE